LSSNRGEFSCLRICMLQQVCAMAYRPVAARHTACVCESLLTQSAAGAACGIHAQVAVLGIDPPVSLNLLEGLEV